MTNVTKNFPLQSSRMEIKKNAQEAEFDGSPAMFESAYRQYVTPVYRYLYLRTGSTEEAEDLTSQVFLAALQGLPHYRQRGYFGAWLFTLARNKLADFYRSHRAQVPFDEAGGEPQAAEADLLVGIIHDEELQRVGKLVASLPEDERELVRLRFAARLGFEEIATVLGKKTSAVKMALYRLLERMEKQLEAGNE